MRMYDKDTDTSTTIDAPTAYGEPVPGGGAVTMNIKPQDRADFIDTFGHADTMTFEFPNGTEPPWSVRMDGTTKAMKAFSACMGYIGSNTHPRPGAT